MSMTATRIPHIVQYQGSKRRLASEILRHMPSSFGSITEPFAGVASVSIAAACEHRTDKFFLNDINAPLVGMLKEAVEAPGRLLDEYSRLWSEQFSYDDWHMEHFYFVRDKFNSGEKSPANMLYLLARCVKGAVRYSADGKFNQSPDKRRHGTSPAKLKANIYILSELMKNKAVFSSCDYNEILREAESESIIYMDPPYQGVSDTRDRRYFSGVKFSELMTAIDRLNSRGAKFLLSYDGICLGKEYGNEIPAELECTKILINSGRSAQHTLLGRKAVTFEALYISRTLAKEIS